MPPIARLDGWNRTGPAGHLVHAQAGVQRVGAALGRRQNRRLAQHVHRDARAPQRRRARPPQVRQRVAQAHHRARHACHMNSAHTPRIDPNTTLEPSSVYEGPEDQNVKSASA